MGFGNSRKIVSSNRCLFIQLCEAEAAEVEFIHSGHHRGIGSRCSQVSLILSNNFATNPHLRILNSSKLRLAYQHLEKRKKQGLSIEHATNATGIELVQCAEAHCRAFLVRGAYEMTKGINKTLSKELAAVLHELIALYSYDTCMKSIGDLLRVSSTICCKLFISW